MHDRSFLPPEPSRTPLPAGTARLRGLWGLTLAASLAVCAAGCAPSLGGAVRAYEHGRYPEAIEELGAVEGDVRWWSASDAARYALYRGLTHLALGDVAASQVWLGGIKRAMDADPALLSADDAGRLASAWAHLPASRSPASPRE